MLTFDINVYDHVYITAPLLVTKFPVGKRAAAVKSRNGRHSDVFGIVWHCLALWHQESSPESTKKASNSPDG